MWTFADDAWLPVVRLNLGDRLTTRFTNRLTRPGEHTSIHWHGIRLPNKEDGVPYLTQLPVEPGASYDYDFTPPDTGTFFFHTHCNTIEQLSRGLAGMLIIDGDTTQPYEADEIIVLRDWRIEAGAPSFLPFYTPEGAGKAGTFGTVRSANGIVSPEIALPASGDCRLRIVNMDPTRIIEIGIKGADAAIVAIDGVAMPPVPLHSWRMGPAMRADLVIRAPPDGETATLVDYFAPQPVALARLAGKGPARRIGAFNPAPLRAGRMPEPDLANATRIRFDFSATATGQAIAAAGGGGGGYLGSLCLSTNSFWAINKQSWPGHGAGKIPPPLALLDKGKSYIFELVNQTPQQHPIHIHGHSFKLIKSNKRDLPGHHADTLLLYPNERIEAAFVADNPGDWMFHCHIIEHQESGMMGYVRVA